MTFLENVSLKDYSTMRLGSNARYLCKVKTEEDLLEAINFAKDNNFKLKVIGSGSNLAWSDEGYPGLVVVNEITHSNFNDSVVTFGAGHNWDEAVEKTVEKGLSGIEFLSLIPGTCGATPIQNVGAYGTEIKQTLIDLRAYDLEKNEFVTIKNEECNFGYRSSRFNRQDKGRFIITEIRFNLSKKNPSPPFYPALEIFLSEKNVTKFTASNIRQAVIDIRTAKLPDTASHPNNGSYFANPILDNDKYTEMKNNYPDMPSWKVEEGHKVSAAWLIDQAGFKDYHDEETGMSTWATQPLVIVNEAAKSTQDLINFRDKLSSAVDKKFGIILQQEPEIV